MEKGIDWNKEKREVQELKIELRTRRMLVKKFKQEVTNAKEHHTHAVEAQKLLQLWAQTIQQHAHEKLSKVVTSCLRAVFPDDPYDFKITFERKRGRTEAVLSFARDGLLVDPLSASGGGVVDVAAFALRVSCLCLHRPRLRRVVILDEPFKFVSEDYLPNVRLMLEELTKSLKIQIVMVTHISELAIGTVVRA